MREHTPEEIAQVIAPQFPETDMETLTTIVKRYHEQDTWKENLIFIESFERLPGFCSPHKLPTGETFAGYSGGCRGTKQENAL